MKSVIPILLITLIFAQDSTSGGRTFESVFAQLAEGQSKGDYGFDLFSEIKQKVSDGKGIVEIKGHINDLKDNLQTDQWQDYEFVSSEKVRLDNEVSLMNQEINQLNYQQTFLDEKIKVLNSQSNIIDNLFSLDDVEYAQRIGTHQSMIDTLHELVNLVNNNLKDANSLIQKSDLFENLKKIGKGNHVEALAELTSHLDEQLVTQILTLFNDLRMSLLESIVSDETKVQENIRIHKSLREEIAQLITDTNTRIDQVSDQIEKEKNEQKGYSNRLVTVVDGYNNRQSKRNVAIKTTLDAFNIVQDNTNQIKEWQNMMDPNTLQNIQP